MTRLPRFNILALTVFCAFAIAGHPADAQQSAVNKDPRYNALAWMQHSAEYALQTRQTYRMALTQLLVGLKDRHWSGDEVQITNGGFEDKSPAIILDCDETVLDNSFYNARNILAGKQYTTQSWNAWCQEAQADAIPGALDFVTAAQKLGVEIFYITNRHDDVKQATIKNLKQLGFPATAENVLTKNAALGRGDDKISRRASVAENHRIVMLIGDSMSDLCSGMDVSDTQLRNKVATTKTAMLGTRWIIIPNPVYGGWERALPKGKNALKTKPYRSRIESNDENK